MKKVLLPALLLTTPALASGPSWEENGLAIASLTFIVVMLIGAVVLSLWIMLRTR